MEVTYVGGIPDESTLIGERFAHFDWTNYFIYLWWDAR